MTLYSRKRGLISRFDSVNRVYSHDWEIIALPISYNSSTRTSAKRDKRWPVRGFAKKKKKKIRDYYGCGWVSPGLTRIFF